MKRIISIVLLAGMSTCSFAAAPTSGANKSSSLATSMNSAWKSYRSVQPKSNPSDPEIVYGGEDIKSPTLLQTAQS